MEIIFMLGGMAKKLDMTNYLLHVLLHVMKLI